MMIAAASSCTCFVDVGRPTLVSSRCADEVNGAVSGEDVQREWMFPRLTATSGSTRRPARYRRARTLAPGGDTPVRRSTASAQSVWDGRDSVAPPNEHLDEIRAGFPSHCSRSGTGV